MNKPKQTLILLLCACMTFSFSACNKETSQNTKTKSPSTEKEFSIKQLSIKDFKWEISEGKEDGVTQQYFNLTNNSKFDLLGAEIHLKPKNNVNDEQLSIFDSFLEKHSDNSSDEDLDEDNEDEDDDATEDEDYDDSSEDYDDDEEDDDNEEDDYSLNTNNIILTSTNSRYSSVNIGGENTRLVKKGESFTDINLYIYQDNLTWCETPSKEQLNLMTPDELSIIIAGPSNKGYVAYYNFHNKKWTLDKTTVTIDKWTTQNIGKQIPNPEAKHFIVRSDEKDDFDILCFGITQKQHEKYIKKLIKSGFKSNDEDEDDKTEFEGTNSKDYTVSATYVEEDQYLHLNITK